MTDTQTTSNTPSHTAYTMRKADNGKSYKTRIGTCWAHRTGGGFTVVIDAVPLDGRIVLFTDSEKPE